MSRWLLEGFPRGAEGIWFEVLVMNAPKQVLFLERILFLFELKKRKAGRAQILRVSPPEWHTECDICTLGGYVMEAMETARDDNNLLIFKPETIKMVRNRFIEGHPGQCYVVLQGFCF